MLNDSDRKILLSHLIRIHRAGVKHNGFEPRNVVMSESGEPKIIDFDNSSHSICTGLKCIELVEVARWLNLDLGACYLT